MYCLLIAYFFSNAFERNFNTTNIAETPIKDLLINLKIFLFNFFDYQGLIGSYFLTIQLAVVVWIILGNKARLAIDFIAIYLTTCWFLELICMNLLLVSPISNPLFIYSCFISSCKFLSTASGFIIESVCSILFIVFLYKFI